MILDRPFIKRYLRANKFDCCDTHTFWEKAVGDKLIELIMFNDKTIHSKLFQGSTYNLIEVKQLTNEEAYFYLDGLLNPLSKFI